jgi:hypothetical protein
MTSSPTTAAFMNFEGGLRIADFELAKLIGIVHLPDYRRRLADGRLERTGGQSDVICGLDHEGTTMFWLSERQALALARSTTPIMRKAATQAVTAAFAAAREGRQEAPTAPIARPSPNGGAASFLAYAAPPAPAQPDVLAGLDDPDESDIEQLVTRLLFLTDQIDRKLKRLRQETEGLGEVLARAQARAEAN